MQVRRVSDARRTLFSVNSLAGHLPLKKGLAWRSGCCWGLFQCRSLSCRPYSPGDDRHSVEVAGKDPKSGPCLGAGQATEAGAAEAGAALEVTDPGFDTDSPVTHPLERAATFVLLASLSRSSVALEQYATVSSPVRGCSRVPL